MFISALNDPTTFSMQVKDTNSASGDGWRKVWGKEAAAINPLAAVNQGRNSLIMESIRKNDWTDYHQFQAKQHPAWYDNVGGEMKQNKLYYGNLIDVQNRSLKEAMQSGDKVEIDKRKAHLDDLINDFKNAPGAVPHVIAFANNSDLAKQHDIPKVANDWFNSPYNNALAASQGRFEDKYWYENPFFADNPGEMDFAIAAVQETRPDIAKIAASINKGAYKDNVASTSFSSAQASVVTPVEDLSIQKPAEQKEERILEYATDVVKEAATMKVEQFAQQFAPTNLATELFAKRQETIVKSSHDYLLDRMNQKADDRKFAIV
ncbi:hypothetical protein QWT69_03900 [Sporosarcina oncorhynchi]|uniref:Uncharacterized protein n=1 Tax=Sporosarcina oncorhynchi TaxID=3056444 RepID=A0ABZ0L7Q5_9BACL|nr:hypothetical protein [Sporosarcina sp. T2O-4]WOV88277.1 hypothetical protein QWT69_03900 [Sporosarcina sp. T2O-4]